MKLEGKMVDILTRIDPKMYTKYVVHEKGRPVIYVKLRKALYGTIQAALLFWKNLTKTLKSRGFKVNPYNSCVANKKANSEQLTIVWHVDDLKISHADSKVVTAIIKKLNNKYGKTASGLETPLTVKRGKIHDYLGMTLDYTTKGKVRIDMKDYIRKILNDVEHLTDGWEGKAITSATENLFKISYDSKKLSKPEADSFHHVVAQLLFLCKRERPDIQNAVAFLTTWVKQPVMDDLQKLKRTI